VITDIYNKKTKGPTLMETFTATGKLKKVLLTTRVVRWLLRTMQKTVPNPFNFIFSGYWATSWFLFAHTLLYHARIVFCVGGSFAYFAPNAHCTVTTDLLCHIPTHKTTCPPERPFSHYIHSHRLAAEMWTTMNNKSLGEKNRWFVPSICTGFVNTCPAVFL
jgi:hypothetical protein